jgi:CHAD domain-containing protein
MNRATPHLTTRLLTARARTLKRHLPGAINGDGRAIHQARVASRRLREAVPVLATGVKGSGVAKARRKIRRLTKALGSVRELDVTLAILDELAALDTLPRHAMEDVRRHVITQRDERRAVMLKRLGHVNLSKLDRRLGDVGEALQQADSERWRDALGSRLVKRSKALGAAVAEAGHMYAPDRLHRVRIAAKKLRYAMELAADAGLKTAAAPVRVLKRAQDTLGRLHDFQVLQTYVAAVQAAPPTRSLPDSGLEIISRALEDRCRHLHARYVAGVPRLTEVVEITRTSIVPLLDHRPRGKRRVLKMALKQRATIGRAAQRVLPPAVSEPTH